MTTIMNEQWSSRFLSNKPPASWFTLNTSCLKCYPFLLQSVSIQVICCLALELMNLWYCLSASFRAQDLELLYLGLKSLFNSKYKSFSYIFILSQFNVLCCFKSLVYHSLFRLSDWLMVWSFTLLLPWVFWNDAHQNPDFLLCCSLCFNTFPLPPVSICQNVLMIFDIWSCTKNRFMVFSTSQIPP